MPVAATPSEAPATEIRLLFVDVASGTVRSDPGVSPAQLFVSQLLTYFDQYALSHQLWAPDGSSFLMPVVDPDGMTRVAVIGPRSRPGRGARRIDRVLEPAGRALEVAPAGERGLDAGPRPLIDG